MGKMESKYGETTVDSSQQSKTGTLTPTTPDAESQQTPREQKQGNTLQTEPGISQQTGEPEIQATLPANVEDGAGETKASTRKRSGQDEKVAASKLGEEQK